MGRPKSSKSSGSGGKAKSSSQPAEFGPARLVNGKHIDGQPLKLIVQVCPGHTGSEGIQDLLEEALMPLPALL